VRTFSAHSEEFLRPRGFGTERSLKPLDGVPPRAEHRPVELHVVLEPDRDTDPEDVERLGRQLRDELRDLDVDDVEPVAGPGPPDGAKSGALSSLTEWLVTLGGGGVLAPVIGTITAWLT